MLYAILLFAFVILIFGTLIYRGITLREIGGYSAMIGAVSASVESGRATHVSFGSSAIRDTSTLSAAATGEILYTLALRAALADKPTLATLSDPVTLGLSQDILRKAYRARDQLSMYRGTMTRWYPQTFAFAAGAGIAILDEDASTNVMTGRFGAELMLLSENAIRYNRFIVAQSDRIDGQAVAYAISDEPLIGEELYASTAYLSRSAIGIGSVVTQDVLRYLVVLALIGLAVLAFLGAKF